MTLWLAAVGGRFAYLVHRARGHAMAWRTALPVEAPQPPSSLFESLQQVLRVAGECPAGPVGDDIRRAACELVEASSYAARHAGRRRMLKAIARIEWRHASGRSREDDPSHSTARDLAAALQCELRAE
ncbi:MAG: hypothetical protein A3F70_03175 [Acidobacteria bacterium RIFCSPLOWO2_12_FULL_67_14]|nr:MAG: hypothetical protein A3H29_18040 [Acidobacteria bacterium RIFCSPLOWO2_02_FULL_67_21]OFW37922.1 MAG: hypothetical protein A3F70_03175 [Acidobacteria bacterium RIFCSPLOWO2_12_FULL_67_14]